MFNQKESNRIHRKERQEFLLDYKTKTGCQICGYKEHPEILVFHHKELLRRKWNGNSRGKSSLSSQNLCKARIIIEITKCLLLCPNCHALIHFPMCKQGYQNVK
jgi:hypothetical protein